MLLTILTDDRVVQLASFAIYTLGLGCITLLIFIAKAYIKDQKQNREKMISQMADFTDALNNKFKTLNNFARFSEKELAMHELHINGLKKNIEDHGAKILHLNKKTTEHEIKIQHLKDNQK
jgi:hypothetical protein